MSKTNTVLKEKWSNVVPIAAKAVSDVPYFSQALIDATVEADYNRLKIKKEIAGVPFETVNKYINLLEAIEKDEKVELDAILNNSSLTGTEKMELYQFNMDINDKKDIRRNETVKYVITTAGAVILIAVGVVSLEDFAEIAVKQAGVTQRTNVRWEAIKSFSPSAVITAIKH